MYVHMTIHIHTLYIYIYLFIYLFVLESGTRRPAVDEHERVAAEVDAVGDGVLRR